ncbi:SDR family NAD(P)-dependent oxidoreductase [Granulicella cerasi]|uniref:SDR family NAD(P)-dependent oxidoreductase n=1 Tax=Granulicella cerasi TaxID=741063 RepID=UPI0021DFCB69|nr:SDR family oxidoreductase [Granulicella cerasi]
MKNYFDLTGKCAVVMGGTTGIGRELALGLAESGADVIATSRSADGVKAMQQEIEALGRRSLDATVDVTSRESVQEFHDKVLAALGKVDILVNCAGITKRVPTLDCTEELWNQIFDVNVVGTLRACQVFGKSMLERGAGRIINIASLSTFAAFLEVAPYCASKAAIGSLTQSLAVEWGPRGVLVNAIAPGVFPTALNSAIIASPRGQELKMRTPLSRFGKAEELVTTALYLASDATSFTNGQIIPVDGGFLASAVNQ